MKLINSLKAPHPTHGQTIAMQKWQFPSPILAGLVLGFQINFWKDVVKMIASLDKEPSQTPRD